MALLHNHGHFVYGPTQNSDRKEIKQAYGHWPFEGEGFKQNWHRGYDAITWTEIRPIFRLDRKGELRLLGGVKYEVGKMSEDPEAGVWGSAYYSFRGLMSPSSYRKALKQHSEERQRSGLAEGLNKASAKEH